MLAPMPTVVSTAGYLLACTINTDHTPLACTINTDHTPLACTINTDHTPLACTINTPPRMSHPLGHSSKVTLLSVPDGPLTGDLGLTYVPP